tara:strand:+ start:6690 stop:7697 length:1008 start_codon:yes stop_codon:yes gene_type:complete
MFENNNFIFLALLNIVFSCAICYLIIPVAKKIGVNYHFIDIPNNRKQKKISLSRAGGLALIFGFAVSLLISIIFISINTQNSVSILLTILLCSIFIFIIGLIDDKNSISPWPRLSFQFFISAIMWSQGIRINSIDFSFAFPGLNQFDLPVILSFLITLIWITGTINALNWMDGLDGLAVGITLITASSYIVKSFMVRDLYSLILSSSILGTSIGFIPSNYYPSKILMGDCGSYFLGFNLATLSIMGSSSIIVTSQNLINFNQFNIFLAVFLLFIPLIDMTFVILSRLLKRKSPFFPDNSHIHHKLLSLGINQKQSVNLIYIFSLFFSIIGFSLFL